MNNKHFAVVLFFVAAALIPLNAKKHLQLPFFTAADAPNWVYVLRDKQLPPAEVFHMENGTLYISGQSAGYLRTKKLYRSFRLKVDWRWTKVLANSGVLTHIQPNDTVWPKCYQVQLKADAAGDIICMNGLWAKECTDTVKTTVPKKVASNEKPLGEWNHMEVIVRGKTMKVYVNGKLQNDITGLTATKGYIGFQNEGKPIEFRNLAIIPLK